jgi:hypothetical protein
MVSLVESLEDKYGEDEEEDQNFAFIVFVSCSPEAKRGLLPHVITLNDYNIGESDDVFRIAGGWKRTGVFIFGLESVR